MSESIGGSAEPVAPLQNPTEFPLADAVEIVRAMLRRDFPEKQIVDPDGAAIEAHALERVLQALARAPQGDPPESNTQRQEWERKAWNAGAAAQFTRTQKAIDRLEAQVATLRAFAQRVDSGELWDGGAIQNAARIALGGTCPDCVGQGFYASGPTDAPRQTECERCYGRGLVPPPVHDALNRVAGGGASSSGSAPPNPGDQK